MTEIVDEACVGTCPLCGGRLTAAVKEGAIFIIPGSTGRTNYAACAKCGKPICKDCVKKTRKSRRKYICPDCTD